MDDQPDVTLGYEPRKWQRQVHLGLDGKRWGVLVCHRRGGKTVAAVLQLIDRAVSLKLPDGRYAYLAPKLNQAKAIAWHYLKRYTNKIPGTKISESELHVTLSNGAQIRIHGADNADSLRGLYKDGVVLDEAAQLDRDLWDSVLRPQLADRNGWALFMGTPDGINLLSDTYFAALSRSDWYAGLFTVDQTDALPLSEVTELRRDMTANAFAREFMCDFNASADDVMIPLDVIEAAMRREAKVFLPDPVICGVDVARFGDDESVLTYRCGRDARSITIKTWRGADTMQVAAGVAASIEKVKGFGIGVDAIFVDETGVGGGVLDRLRQLGYAVTGVNNGAKSDYPVIDGSGSGILVANKGAEMWCRMKEWLKSGGAISDDHILRQQLASRRYGYNGNNEIVLEKKSDMKKRGLVSCDRADSLSLTFSMPVNTRLSDGSRQLNTTTQAKREYNPLAEMAKR